jgi:heme exporter protein D
LKILFIFKRNHLSGLTATYLKVSFLTVQELLKVRKELLPIVSRNVERQQQQQQAPESFIEFEFRKE